ncbi:MAG: delta-60 repeat domain-containing protein [Burkholderiales bacterium]
MGLVALAAYVLCAAHIHADTLSRDATFASNGLFKTEIGPHTDSFKGAYGMAVQADGKVVLAGVCNGAAESDFCVARLTAAGQFDTTFNGTASVISPVAAVGAYGRGGGAGGRQDRGGWRLRRCRVPDQLCVRYTAAGALDTSFNSTGRVVTTFASSGAETSVANAVAIQSDQKIVAGGVCNCWGQPDVLHRPLQH